MNRRGRRGHREGRGSISMKAAKLEIGVRSQEERGRRKEEEGRSQKKCFYKYEMLPRGEEHQGDMKPRFFGITCN
jgi:hypothetical protein